MFNSWLVGSYNSPSLIIVYINEVPQVTAPLTGVHKLPCKHPAKVHIVATASPVPVWTPWPSSPVVTGARLDRAFRTGSCHRMGNTSTCDGEHKCRLSAAWQKRNHSIL